MGDRRYDVWTAAGAVAAGAVLAAASVVLAAGRVPGPTWAAATVGAVVACAAITGKRAVEALGTRLAEPVERVVRRSAARNALLGPAQRVVDSRERMALSIHTAIPLPRDADPGLSSSLPEYIPRRIDSDIRAWIRAHTRTGGLVVLVGEAAAGKTRCLYEALCAEVPLWGLPHIETGAQLNALVREGVDLSQSVVWLDEFQNFFGDEALTAPSVRQLVAGRHGPVLMAATIRTEELDRLLHSTEPSTDAPEGSDAIGRRHAREVIKMLARWSPRGEATERAMRFHVDSRLSAEERTRAQALAAIDPRIEVALRGAEDERITATLAGAPELIERWTLDSGDRNGQAVITAAVVARRCGHPEVVPMEVLEALAMRALSAQAHVPLSAQWLSDAIAWAENPIEGRISALRRSATSPGVVEGFKVSDILLQHSYSAARSLVRPLLDDEGTWSTLLAHASPYAGSDIGLVADAEGRTELARRAWRRAADAGDLRAMHWLGWSCTRRGDHAEGASWFRRAIDLGDNTAMWALARCLHGSGDFTGEERWLREAASQGDASAMVDLGVALSALGRQDEAETWLRRAAGLGEAVAMANLGYLWEQRGDLTQSEHWNRQGAVVGHPGAIENLAHLLKNRGDTDEALRWYRRGAERARALMQDSPAAYRPWPGESQDQGVSDTVLGLARMLLETGRTEEAEVWFHETADRGDPRAAAALADIEIGRGEPSLALFWRRTAAESADALLTRSRHSLRASYGELGVRRHVRILRRYAECLADQGDAAGAAEWNSRGDRHTSPGSLP
ncbi:tetratricopeptide repeat protein [Streptomyces sp. NBC_00648]|uniref:tetratricopeptide repeat protein n=1 Tax=Streptomyces sp. NBC_00648 TaxID=2975797 RepID=UPI003250D2F7